MLYLPTDTDRTEFKETYLHQIVSFVSVLISHSCGVCANGSRAIAKVPQAHHRIRYGEDVGSKFHRLINESIPWHSSQICRLQHILYQYPLGDFLTLQTVENLHVNGQITWFFWSVVCLE